MLLQNIVLSQTWKPYHPYTVDISSPIGQLFQQKAVVLNITATSNEAQLCNKLSVNFKMAGITNLHLSRLFLMSITGTHTHDADKFNYKW